MKKVNMKVLKKVIIAAIVVVFLFAGYALIPSKKVIDKNLIIEKVKTAKENTKADDDILIMAEKGGYLLYPENTEMAFNKSIKTDSYVDIVELDIRTTADGHLVIIEDETINRLALTEDAEPLYVNKTNLADLQKYNMARNFKNLNGDYVYRDSDRFSAQGLTLLTLESFLTKYKSYTSSKLYMFDFQESGEEGQNAVKKALELLEKEDYEKYQESVILSSDDAKMVNWMTKEYADKYLICGGGEITESLLNACKLGFKIFNNPIYSVVQYDVKAKGLFGIKFNTARKGFVHKIEEKNIAIIFNNINTEKDVEKVYGIGAHVISTGNYQLVHTTLGELTK